MSSINQMFVGLFGTLGAAVSGIGKLLDTWYPIRTRVTPSKVRWLDDGKFWATCDQGVLRHSTDGKTWNTVFAGRTATSVVSFTDIAYNPNSASNGFPTYMAVSSSTVMTSTDGLTWIQITLPTSGLLFVTWNSTYNRFIAASSAGVYSYNNSVWSSVPGPGGVSGIATANGVTVISTTGYIYKLTAAATATPVYTKPTSATSITSISLALDGVTGIATMTNDTNNNASGISTTLIVRTTNSGANWSYVPTGNSVLPWASSATSAFVGDKFVCYYRTSAGAPIDYTVDTATTTVTYSLYSSSSTTMSLPIALVQPTYSPVLQLTATAPSSTSTEDPIISTNGIIFGQAVSESIANQYSFQARPNTALLTKLSNGVYVASSNGYFHYSLDNNTWFQSTKSDNVSIGSLLSAVYCPSSVNGTPFYAASGTGIVSCTTSSYPDYYNIRAGSSIATRLATDGNTVVGAINATGTSNIMTSTNGTTWTTRTTSGFSTSVYDIAYGNGRFVISGAPSGTATSVDGGATWTKVTAPQLMTIEFDGTRFVATGNGSKNYYTSTDGATWTTLTNLPVATATASRIIHNNGVYAYITSISSGVTANAIYVSADNFATWQTITVPASYFTSLSAFDGKFRLVCSYGATILESTNGINWSFANINDVQVSSGATSGISVVDDTLYSLPAQYGQMPLVKYDSIDNSFSKVSYVPFTANAARTFAFTKFKGDYYVTVGLSGSNTWIVRKSTAAQLNQTSYSVATPAGWPQVASLSGTALMTAAVFATNPSETVLVLGSTGSKPCYSVDGTTWAVATTGPATVTDVVWNPSLNAFFAIGATNTVWTSADGITWTQTASITSANLTTITYGAGVMLIGSNATNQVKIYSSIDGTGWTARTATTAIPVTSIAYSGNLFIATSNGVAGTALASTDGLLWTSAVSPSVYPITQIKYAGDSFYAVTTKGHIVRYTPS